MNTLICKLEEQGADIKGAMERFIGDEQLYATCFKSFLQDKAFEGLKIAVDSQNYKDAFDCAHTLKGVAGNLGLTEMFDTLSDVLESLRTNFYINLQRQEQAVRTVQDKLFQLI